MPDTKNSKSLPLNYTRKANHRIFAGLGWDPHEKAGLVDKARALAGGRKAWHDLDLSCFLYDRDLNYITHVGVDPDHAADASGKIYHSGDNVQGVGEGDDEQVSVELKGLDENIRHIVFAASIKSGHDFSDIEAPEIHLADGYTHRSFLTVALRQEDGKGKSAFLFVHIKRDGEGWTYREIGEFLDFEPGQSLQDQIKAHL